MTNPTSALEAAIEAAAEQIRSAFVEYYPFGTPLRVFENIIHNRLDPLFAAQESEIARLRKALEGGASRMRHAVIVLHPTKFPSVRRTVDEIVDEMRRALAQGGNGE